VHRDAGRHARALELGRSALAIAREVDYPRGVTDALNGIAATYLRIGQRANAGEYHHQALTVARRIGARYSEAVALIGLAATNQPAGGRSQIQQALDLTRRAGFRVLEANALTMLAGIDLACGEVDRAIGTAEQALRMHREAGHRFGVARTLAVLGDAMALRPQSGTSR
jgi:tetratricopeptide (TPR) repeat protein